MTRANPGARIRDPKVDWEWHPLRYGETERTCVDCGTPFKPTGRVQKYCLKCKPRHRGMAAYGGKDGYAAFKAARIGGK